MVTGDRGGTGGSLRWHTVSTNTKLSLSSSAACVVCRRCRRLQRLPLRTRLQKSPTTPNVPRPHTAIRSLDTMRSICGDRRLSIPGAALVSRRPGLPLLRRSVLIRARRSLRCESGVTGQSACRGGHALRVHQTHTDSVACGRPVGSVLVDSAICAHPRKSPHGDAGTPRTHQAHVCGLCGGTPSGRRA